VKGVVEAVVGLPLLYQKPKKGRVVERVILLNFRRRKRKGGENIKYHVGQTEPTDFKGVEEGAKQSMRL